MSSTDGQGHDSRAIANIFVEKFQQDDKQLTITQIVKLVYIAHGWTLGYTGDPLICHEVEAWRYGPVVPVVYKAFRPQGIIIQEYAKNNNGEQFSAIRTSRQDRIIDGVYKNYSPLSVTELTGITHGRGTPWHQFYNGTFYQTMPNDAIQTYYEGCVKRLEEKYNS